MWSNVLNGTRVEALSELEKESVAVKEMIFLRLKAYRNKLEETICGKQKYRAKLDITVSFIKKKGNTSLIDI